MNGRVTRVVWVIVFSVAAQGLLEANVPQLIAYQGRLTNADGSSLVGDHTIRFRLYDAETSGSLLWEEEHRVTMATEDNGIFSLILGSLQAFGTLHFTQPLWLSLEVDGEGEMTPRMRLTAVGYAINADTLDGFNASQFLRSDVNSESKGQLKLTRSGFGLLIQPLNDPPMTANLLEVRRAGGSPVMTLDLGGTLNVASIDLGDGPDDDLVASDLAVLTGGPTSNADALHTHSGSGLVDLNASNLTSGTIPDARLSAAVSLLGPSIESAEITDGTIAAADLGVDSIGAAQLRSDAIQPGDIEVGDLPATARASTSATSSLAIGTSDTTLLSVAITKARADSALLILASVSITSGGSGGGKDFSVKLRRDGTQLDGTYETTVTGGDKAIVTVHALDTTGSGSHTIELQASASKTGATATVRRLTVVEIP